MSDLQLTSGVRLKSDTKSYDKLVDFDDNYLALGETMEERANAYRLFMRDSITEQELKITQNVLNTK